MIVRYNGNRTFKIWEDKGIWYGTDVRNVKNGKLTISYKECLAAKSKDDMIDMVEAHCRFDELVDNGMDRTEAARLALFGE